MKKILVLGYFGYHTNQLDGQTVKTRNLLDLLKQKFSDVGYFDTQSFRYDKYGVCRMLIKILYSRTICYLPAQNNLLYIFPFLFVLAKVFRIKLLYFIVGGWLVEFLADKPFHRWMLRHLDGIFSETQLMKILLDERYGIRGVEVFPNFRMVSHTPVPHHTNGQLKLVFLARINRMKGLDTLFMLAGHIREKYHHDEVTLDFYGHVNEEDAAYFYQEVEKFPFVRYRGELQPQDIYRTIEQYDVMLLPTHYYTEGLPGTVLDAYMSGIPVVVSRWKHAEEFVKDGQTGYIIPFKEGEKELCQRVDFLWRHEDVLLALKERAYEESRLYSTDRAWNILEKYL